MNSFEQAYKKLNKAQKEAVDSVEGPVLVVAGPGSGKTQILSLRVGKILKDTHATPSNILCLTFTESATTNMRNRLAGFLGIDAYRVAIHTFHNFCVDIIQRNPEYFYGGAFYTTIDELAQTQILQEIFEGLPHNNPLRSFHPEQGFVYLRDVKNVIGYLKQAGVLPEEFRNILEHNKKYVSHINKILQPVCSERIGKDSLIKFQAAVKKLSDIATTSSEDFPSPFFKTLPSMVAADLTRAIESSLEQEKATPLSAWKSYWMKKNDKGESVFRDATYFDKLFAVADIYEQYRAVMQERGFYDFNDMILDVLSVLEKNPALRYELQEQYQYILVDEFQDTNDAQMRLIHYLTDAPIHEGKPNIMVVGDDDQAVYKFQGAEISNILNFKKNFPDTKVVTMVENYRSTQDILDVASHMIRKGEERLENLLPEIKKNLVSSNKELGKGNIIQKEFLTQPHEFHFVAQEISRRIKAGEKPEDIAVISRKHKQLEMLVPYLRAENIPICYEREQNVFAEPHIAQLITLAKFIASLVNKKADEADELLPQILSFPFWNIKRETIWNISLAARRGEEQKTWLEVMLDHKDETVRKVASFLIELGGDARSAPLEHVLDTLIGAHAPLAEESGEDEEEALNHDKNDRVNGEKFISPFKEYYFSKERFDFARAEYLGFLSSLRVFVNALREYKQGEVLNINDLVEFVNLHEKNNIALNDQSPFSKIDGAVNLLSAHKAKGLEFETVFVLSCQDSIWAGRGMVSKLSLPTNMPIEPAGDTQDDQLRLFYVAITRARKHLFLTSYKTEESGKESSKLRFLLLAEDSTAQESVKKVLLEPELDQTKIAFAPDTHEVLTASWVQYHTAPFIASEQKLLESLVKDYSMPVTHLNNFLNVAKGGPQYFLEQNLLRFPQAKTPSSSYGSAVHRTLEWISKSITQGIKVSENEIAKQFEKFLKREKLAQLDYNMYLEKGCHDLVVFWNNNHKTFTESDVVEFNFKDQGVVVEGAKLTGKIDRIIADHGEALVCDYKTGKPKEDWNGRDDYEKVKMHQYENQLLFYKLLVENSREFGGKLNVIKGELDFIEPKMGKNIALELDIDPEKIERLTKIVAAVYKKIMSVDFPSVEKYSKDIDGVLEFEEDLIAGRV